MHTSRKRAALPEKETYDIPYPLSRQLTFDLGKVGLKKHHVKALLEVNVTEARRIIKQNRQTDTKISFFAWLIKMKLFVRLPQWLRLILMRHLVLNDPQRMKNRMGTVMITTAGLIGHTRG